MSCVWNPISASTVWNSQVNKVLNITSSLQLLLFQLSSPSHFLRLVDSKTLLVLASVHSRLDYCNSVLYSLPWSRLQLLQSVLNSAACLIRGWSISITCHRSWLICIGFLTHSVSNTKSACWCSSVLKVSLRLTLLLFALRVQRFLVGRLWDPPFVGILLCLATGRTGVWEPLLLLVPAVGMSCQLNWGIWQLVPRLLQNTWIRTCSELVFSDGARTFEFV